MQGGQAQAEGRTHRKKAEVRVPPGKVHGKLPEPVGSRFACTYSQYSMYDEISDKHPSAPLSTDSNLKRSTAQLCHCYCT